MKLTKQRLHEIIKEELAALRDEGKKASKSVGDPDRVHGVKPAPVRRTIRKKDIGSDLGLGDHTVSSHHVRGAQLRRRANRAAGYSSSGHRTQAGQKRLEAPGTEPADQPALDVGIDPAAIAAVRQAAIEKQLAAEEPDPTPSYRVLPSPDGTMVPAPVDSKLGFPVDDAREYTAAERAEAEAKRQAWAAKKAAEKGAGLAGKNESLTRSYLQQRIKSK